MNGKVEFTTEMLDKVLAAIATAKPQHDDEQLLNLLATDGAFQAFLASGITAAHEIRPRLMDEPGVLLMVIGTAAAHVGVLMERERQWAVVDAGSTVD